jgi:hypothetical protein
MLTKEKCANDCAICGHFRVWNKVLTNVSNIGYGRTSSKTAYICAHEEPAKIVGSESCKVHTKPIKMALNRAY